MAKEINIYSKISIPSFEDQVPHTTLKFILPHTHTLNYGFRFTSKILGKIKIGYNDNY